MPIHHPLGFEQHPLEDAGMYTEACTFGRSLGTLPSALLRGHAGIVTRRDPDLWVGDFGAAKNAWMC